MVSFTEGEAGREEGRVEEKRRRNRKGGGGGERERERERQTERDRQRERVRYRQRQGQGGREREREGGGGGGGCGGGWADLAGADARGLSRHLFCSFEPCLHRSHGCCFSSVLHSHTKLGQSGLVRAHSQMCACASSHTRTHARITHTFIHTPITHLLSAFYIC